MAQLKIRNPQQADYKQARELAEKAVQVGSKAGEIIPPACWSTIRPGRRDYSHAITPQDAAQIRNDSAVDAQMLLGLIYAKAASRMTGG